MTTQPQPDPARAALLAARRDALSQAAQLVRMAEAQRAAAEALERAVRRLDDAEGADAATVTPFAEGKRGADLGGNP